MSSWLYKLRRKRSCDANTTGFVVSSKAAAAASHNQKPPPPSPATPNRASYYIASRDRAGLSPKQHGNPKLRDTRFPRSPQQPGDIVFDVVARRDDRFGFGGVDDDEAVNELKLRPIITRPAPTRAHAHGDGDEASDSSGTGAASPTATRRRMRRRLHLHDASRRKKVVTSGKPAEEETGRLRWVYESVVVVKESAKPEEDFLASMAEMIAAHDDVRSPRGLQELLACYLALNAADHHRAIVAAFRRAWLERVTPPRECCRLHARYSA